MSQPVVLLDKPFTADAASLQEWLEERAEVLLLTDTLTPKECARVEALLWYGHDRVDSTLLDRFPNLKVVSNFGTGYEFIDCDAAVSRGIPVGHTPGCLADAVADLAWGLLLAAARDIVGGAARAAASTFSRINNDELGKQVTGATLGIVGLGAIGTEIARRATGFRMRVLYHSRRQRDPSEEAAAGNAVYCAALDDLLAASDYVVLVVPATPATTHMMSGPQFEAMKRDAILINIARGVVVDQEALVRALATGELGGAALDVTEPEPLPRDHPLVATEGTPLQGKVLITPHQGSATAETRMAMLMMAFDNVLAGVDPSKPRLPWTVSEAEMLFAPGARVGATTWSKRQPKP